MSEPKPVPSTVDLIDILARPEAFVRFSIRNGGRWEKVSHKFVRGLLLTELELVCRRGLLAWEEVSPE